MNAIESPNMNERLNHIISGVWSKEEQITRYMRKPKNTKNIRLITFKEIKGLQRNYMNRILKVFNVENLTNITRKYYLQMLLWLFKD